MSESVFETVREEHVQFVLSVTLTRAGAIMLIVAVTKIEEAKNRGDECMMVRWWLLTKIICFMIYVSSLRNIFWLGTDGQIVSILQICPVSPKTLFTTQYNYQRLLFVMCLTGQDTTRHASKKYFYCNTILMIWRFTLLPNHVCLSIEQHIT